MWMSSPACFWMAATTCGWQWPVETTAMPAEKSRNSLPSTSSMMSPRPRLATSGYERVYEGERYLASPSSTRCALGPGSLVLMLGTAVAMVAMGIFSDSDFVCDGAGKSTRGKMPVQLELKLRQKERKRAELVAAEKVGTSVGRQPLAQTARAGAHGI